MNIVCALCYTFGWMVIFSLPADDTLADGTIVSLNAFRKVVESLFFAHFSNCSIGEMHHSTMDKNFIYLIILGEICCIAGAWNR